MIAPSSVQAQLKPDSAVLLAWYDRHARILPWRVLSGEKADPYRVWLSEVMLQQTTVQAVKSYFEAFLLRWPTVMALAAAPVDDIMKMWAGLGYYSRARNLHACAKEVVKRFDGNFPSDEASLRTLPGIGSYTAAAISAIAFGIRAVVVDGNVERVIARLHRLDVLMPAAKLPIKTLTDQLTPDHRPGDFAQAMMDLGATICTPRSPACAICPFFGACAAQIMGDPQAFPRKAPKAVKQPRYGLAFVVTRQDGALLVRTRPPKGLLGGMVEVPCSDWSHDKNASHRDFEPMPLPWKQNDEVVRHVFTHFPLELTVLVAASVPSDTLAPYGMRWISTNEISGEAFPTLFRKVLKVVHL
jgi:A/G-specific adenine glycosylase